MKSEPWRRPTEVVQWPSGLVRSGRKLATEESPNESRPSE